MPTNASDDDSESKDIITEDARHIFVFLPSKGSTFCFDGLNDEPYRVCKTAEGEAWFDKPLAILRRFFDTKQIGDVLVIADV